MRLHCTLTNTAGTCYNCQSVVDRSERFSVISPMNLKETRSQQDSGALNLFNAAQSETGIERRSCAVIDARRSRVTKYSNKS